MTTAALLNFSKGELSEEIMARFDTGQYNAGAGLARNFIIQRQGGLAARPGFRVVGRLDNVNDAARLIPFQYSIEQAYVLLFQQASARPMANGGFVLEEDDLKIEAILDTDPLTVTISNHGYTVGERIFLDGLSGTLVDQLNNRELTVSALPDDNTVVFDVAVPGVVLADSTGDVRAIPVTPDPPPDPPTPTPDPPTPPATGGGSGWYDDGFWSGWGNLP